MKNPELVVIGNLSIDRVKNKWGENVQLGGAALYTSLGAKVLMDEVRVISVVGKDYRYLDFIYSNFPGSIIKKVNLPSTFFRISYDEKFKAKYDEVKLGAGALLRVDDLPYHLIKKENLFHIAPLSPRKAERFIDKIKGRSPGTWVSMTTSPDYIEKSSNRKILRRIMSKVDLFIVNDYEAMFLAETESLISAVSSLKAKRLAVTLGPIGAIFVENGKIQMIPALGGLTLNPKDTTGAGDTWCGCLLASYIKTGDWTKSVVAACLISAIKCLDWGFEKIKRLRFRNLDDVIVHVLSLSQNTGQLTLEEFLSRDV